MYFKVLKSEYFVGFEIWELKPLVLEVSKSLSCPLCKNCSFGFRVVHSSWPSVLLGDKLHNHKTYLHSYDLLKMCVLFWWTCCFWKSRRTCGSSPLPHAFLRQPTFFDPFAAVHFEFLHFLRDALVYHFQEPRLASLRRCPLTFKVR